MFSLFHEFLQSSNLGSRVGGPHRVGRPTVNRLVNEQTFQIRQDLHQCPDLEVIIHLETQALISCNTVLVTNN